MKLAVLGAKYDVSSLKRFHAVLPAPPASSAQRNTAPPQSATSMPRCARYHAPSAFGSLALKNTPPTPVTRFMVVSWGMESIVQIVEAPRDGSNRCSALAQGVAG